MAVGSRYTTDDVKYFFLNKPLEGYKYMQIALADIPDKIIDKYNLRDIPRNGKIAVKIRNGMYRLPQAGLLSHKQLVTQINGYGYAPVKFTNGMWKNCDHQLTFTLVVGDFGVKCVN